MVFKIAFWACTVIIEGNNQDPDRRISYQLGFHAEYTTSRELMEGLSGLSEKYKIPVYVHCSETKKEVEDCRTRTGMTPVAYMDSLGLFAHGGGLQGSNLHGAFFRFVFFVRQDINAL